MRRYFYYLGWLYLSFAVNTMNLFCSTNFCQVNLQLPNILFFLFSCKDQGPHIYQTCPSANFFDCKAMAIGARSQSARTYLEKHLTEFLGSSLEDLVKHGLRALRDTLPNEMDLSTKVDRSSFMRYTDSEQKLNPDFSLYRTFRSVS